MAGSDKKQKYGYKLPLPSHYNYYMLTSPALCHAGSCRERPFLFCGAVAEASGLGSSFSAVDGTWQMHHCSPTYNIYILNIYKCAKIDIYIYMYI